MLLIDTLSSDIWAFGCVVFQFVSGRPPFKEATNYLTMKKIQSGKFSFPSEFDLICKDLVEKILVWTRRDEEGRILISYRSLTSLSVLGVV